jgi:hypothetical protein
MRHRVAVVAVINQKARPSCLSALTAAALVLPGLMLTSVQAADDDEEVDFQYSHYQEGEQLAR